MSPGADAMGVATRVSPALILAVVAVLAPPAVGQSAAPASSPPESDRIELIDPDCEPEKAELADPLLVEEPDGICPPGEADSPGDEPPAEPPRDTPREPPPDQPALSQQPPAGTPGALEAPPANGIPQGSGRAPVQAGPKPNRRGGGAPREPRARKRDELSGRRRAPARDPSVRVPRLGARRRAEASPRKSTARARRVQPRAFPAFPVASHEALPDPLPPARRLDPAFARRLQRVAERFRVPWELMLAVRRARGHDGPSPADRARLRALARRLVSLGARKNPRRAIRRLSREIVTKPHFVRRVVALAHLNRAIGMRGLVRGLKRIRRGLVRKVLESRRLVIYPGGRSDIESGVTDVRVLVLLRYLASRYHEVVVTSLTTGHSYLTASGNVSAHSYGRAVDIAALNGQSILGNQDTGGLTERALRSILLLPEQLEPSELISLFELGGPSFALADHADHIHVGY